MWCSVNILTCKNWPYSMWRKKVNKTTQLVKMIMIYEYDMFCTSVLVKSFWSYLSFQESIQKAFEVISHDTKRSAKKRERKKSGCGEKRSATEKKHGGINISFNWMFTKFSLQKWSFFKMIVIFSPDVSILLKYRLW